MTKKLKILGPYTPDHKGPYAWITGHPTQCVVHSVVDNVAFITVTGGSNPFICSVDYIRNAEEVPEAREFWVVGKIAYDTHAAAYGALDTVGRLKIIHVREVLPGEEA